MILVGGSLLERSAQRGRYYNTATVYGRDGALLGRYRKTHLFDVDIPGHVTHRESESKVPGDAVVVVPTDVRRAGVEHLLRSALPGALPPSRRGRGGDRLSAIGVHLPHRRAPLGDPVAGARHRGQLYVVAPNQIGRSPSGVQDFGHSLIVDPRGTPIARATNSETAIVAEVDLDYLARVRRELPCLEHRKFDV